MTPAPAPPGYRVSRGQLPNRRFVDPHPSNLFLIGLSQRGLLAQGRGAGDLVGAAGVRQAYSSLHDDANAAIIESTGSAWTFSRVTGPAAVAASVTFSNGAGTPIPSIKITAKSVGEWGNALKAQILEPTSGKRRIVITESDNPAVTSPIFSTLAEIVAWSDDEDNDYVDITALGAVMPGVFNAAPFTGGDADLDGVDTDAVAAALDRCEKRFGPGLIVLCGLNDVDTRKVVSEHCEEFNRVLFSQEDRGTTVSDMQSHQDELRADVPDTAYLTGTFGNYAWTRPISTDPERLSAGAAVWAGVQSRVLRQFGLKQTAFGPDNVVSQTITRLDRQFTEAERTALYAKGINVLTDDGRNFSTWGYATADLNPLGQDLHHSIVEMWLRWELEGVMRWALGHYINPDLISSTAGALEAKLIERQRDGAINGTTVDPGYRIDLDSVNDEDTAEARQFYGRVTFRHAGTSDWSELLLLVTGPSAQTI